VFTNLAYNISHAWRDASPRNFLHIRLVGLAMIGGLTMLFLLSLIGVWITKLIPLFNMEAEYSPLLELWRLLSRLGSWLSIFLLYLALYHWVPPVRVNGMATFWAALTASLGWKIATAGFSQYLRSGLESYRLIYGSVGAILLLLLLIYILAAITLFCAHLCAAIDFWTKQRRRQAG
jgi:membrane protein